MHLQLFHLIVIMKVIKMMDKNLELIFLDLLTALLAYLKSIQTIKTITSQKEIQQQYLFSKVIKLTLKYILAR